MNKYLIMLGLLSFNYLNATVQNTTVSITVKESKPIKKTVVTRIAYMDCEHVEINETKKQKKQEVTGGIIGSVIGSGVGAVLSPIGSSVGLITGLHVGEKYLAPQLDNYKGIRLEKECVKQYKKSKIDKIVGYKNYAEYEGIKIIKVSEEPLSKINMELEINY